MSRLLRVFSSVVLAGSLVLTGSAAVAAPVPIGPNQFFVGLVNDRRDQAAIRMACFGPGRPGQLGSPLPGQTVAVREALPFEATAARTGSEARSIVAFFSPSPDADPTVVFTEYGVAAEIPTSFKLPCAGRGEVVFFPRPGSPTATAYPVDVTFVSQP